MWYSRLKQADAFSTDYIENMHHPELKGMPAKSEIVVYHGTSIAKFAAIMRHGSLDPQISQSKKNYEQVTTGGIYVTINPGFGSAELYAHQSSANDKSDNIVLEMVVPYNWIEHDPDDTRIDEQGVMNSQGRTQGIIRRAINIRRIRQVKALNPVLSQAAPSKDGNPFNRLWTQWMPIAKFYKLVQKAVENGQLDENYKIFAGGTYPGLSRKGPKIDSQQEFAERLACLLNTHFDMNLVNFEKILVWAYKNQNAAFGPAVNGTNTFLEAMQPGLSKRFQEEVQQDYQPKPAESLQSFLNRICR